MTIEKIIAIAIEKGLSILLSGLVIYFIIQLIKHAPSVIKEFLDITRQMSIATENSTDVIKDTKEMHDIMDRKIDIIQKTIEELKTLIIENSEMRAELMQKIEKLESEVSELKKQGAGASHASI